MIRRPKQMLVGFWTAAWLAAFSGCGDGSSRQHEPAEKLYAEARQLLDAGQSGAAIQKLNQVLDLDLRHTAAFYSRAIAHKNQGDAYAALADLTQAVRLDPTFVEAYLQRGALYRSKGFADKAILDYSEAIRLRPREPDGYYGRGLAYVRPRRVAFRRGGPDRGHPARPQGRPRLRGSRAVYQKREDLRSAIADYTRAIQLDPSHAEAYFHRGIALEKSGDATHAIDDLTEAIRLKPRSPPPIRSGPSLSRARLGPGGSGRGEGRRVDAAIGRCPQPARAGLAGQGERGGGRRRL